MQSIEITGKSVDEAKKSAAAKLGVSAGDLKVTVLEETKGLFGKSNVRIRAEVSASPAPKSAVVETPAAPEVKEIEESFNEPPPAKVAKEQQAEKPRRGRAKKAEVAPATEDSTTEEFAEEGATQGPNATDADADQLATLVEDMIESAGLDVKIKGTTAQGRYVNIELDGRDVAHLVGKHGEVLNALQYLVNIIAGRKFNNGIRATLDGNNYRHRREEQLNTLAMRVAEEVRRRGEEAVLDALPAFERRIVHKSLSDYEGIQTYSEGEEPNRRVVIAPAD